MWLLQNWLEALLYVDIFITKLPEGNRIADLFNYGSDFIKELYKVHPGLQDAELIEIRHWITDPDHGGVDVGLIIELDFGKKEKKYLEMVTYSYGGNKPDVPQCWNFKKRQSPHHPYQTVQPDNLWVKKASSFYREAKSD